MTARPARLRVDLNPWALALTALALLGCEQAPVATEYQGYVEADLVDIGAVSAGRIRSIPVRRGDIVQAGTPLFEFDDTMEQASVAQAQARIMGAQARVDNLIEARRAPELQALEAQARGASAAVELSRMQLDQAERLFRSGFVSKARLDEAQAAHARDRARWAEMQAQIANAAGAIGRSAEIKAARTEVEAAQAMLIQAQWQRDQKRAVAPQTAMVYDTYFSPSEWVAAGAPVVSLLPPGQFKLRFFVPEADLARVQPGQPIEARCTGCPQPIAARIEYISPRPEYTPPIIYSRSTRAKLVFLVEARATSAASAGLHPGQPIDVVLGVLAPDPAAK